MGNQARSAVQERIVDAAVRLFARQGFTATTTRGIARLADVNEASLFRYFASKEELFWAALQSRLSRLRIRRELKKALAERANPDLVVPLIIELLVEVAAYESELIRLMEVGLLELRPSAERLYRQQITPIFDAISEYLTDCVSNRRLRAMDPSVATIALSTTVLAHQYLHKMFGQTGIPYSNSKEAVSAYSKFWLDLLRPENGAPSSIPVAYITGKRRPVM